MQLVLVRQFYEDLLRTIFQNPTNSLITNTRYEVTDRRKDGWTDGRGLHISLFFTTL